MCEDESFFFFASASRFNAQSIESEVYYMYLRLIFQIYLVWQWFMGKNLNTTPQTIAWKHSIAYWQYRYHHSGVHFLFLTSSTTLKNIFPHSAHCASVCHNKFPVLLCVWPIRLYFGLQQFVTFGIRILFFNRFHIILTRVNSIGGFIAVTSTAIEWRWKQIGINILFMSHAICNWTDRNDLVTNGGIQFGFLVLDIGWMRIATTKSNVWFCLVKQLDHHTLPINV